MQKKLMVGIVLSTETKRNKMGEKLGERENDVCQVVNSAEGGRGWEGK